MSQSYSSSPRSAHVVRASLPRALRRLLVVSGCLFFALLTLSYYLRWERIEPNKLSQSVSQWRNRLGHLSSYSSESQHRSPKPKAAFVALVRERNLDGMLQTMQDLQLTFNDHPDHGYDYVRHLLPVPKPDLILSSALGFSLGRAFHGLVQRPCEVIFVSDSNQATGPFWYRPQGRLGYPFPY